MTDRINLTRIREHCQAYERGDFVPDYNGGLDIDTHTVLALIDAVEAAQEFANEGFDNGVPGDPFDKLHQALDRFDHT